LNDWIVWQVADSAFPSGGFAHSAGLEAAWQHGIVNDGDSLASFAAASLTQIDRGVLRFVIAAHQRPEGFGEIDAECDLFLNNHVANRASRAQGRAFLVSSAGTFESAGAVVELAKSVRAQRSPGHLAPVFGAVMAALDVGRDRAGELFKFIALRGLMSSAVRLGIVGPIEAQQIQARVRITDGNADEPPVQVSPVMDLLQATQDRLYSRLFQS
jgi:urease accessory protein